MSLQRCRDTSDLVELCERYNLFLKPLRKIKICVQLPALKIPGQSISSWQVMENLKKMVKPDEFITLKVAKSNLVLMQFEAEVEKKVTVNRVLQKLQSNSMKLNGFNDVLKIRAATAKLNFPTRHDWDSFFRDAKNNETNPGERPDTIYFQNLPTKWFVDRSSTSEKPSEYMLKRVFETFGDIRTLEIPSIHKSCSSNEVFKKISGFDQEHVFDAYVQYQEYIGFVKAMDSLKGMKLAYVNKEGEAYSAGIKVDFDKTKYLTDQAIHLRAHERLKPAGVAVTCTSERKDTIIKAKRQNSTECSASSTKKSPKPLELKKTVLRKAKLVREKEATFLLKELLQKAKVIEIEKQAKLREEQIAQEKLQQQKLKERMLEEEKKQKEEKDRVRKKLLDEQERLLRQKLLKNLRDQEQRKTELLREKLRKEISGRKILKSVLVSTHKVKTKKSNHKTRKLYSDDYY